MFGFIKRALSIESMANAVASKIERDMARDPLSPRNRAGAAMVQSIHAVRDRAIAQVDYETLMQEANRRLSALQERAARFNAQSDAYRAEHIHRDGAEMRQEESQIQELMNRANALRDRWKF